MDMTDEDVKTALIWVKNTQMAMPDDIRKTIEKALQAASPKQLNQFGTEMYIE